MKTTAGVPTVESSFCLNLAKLLRASQQFDSPALTLDGGGIFALVILSPDLLVLSIDGAVSCAAIVAVPCLGNRSRPLLKCPRAHEGRYQSLYYRNGELACRHCHSLRYRTTLASSATTRARLARLKLLRAMGGQPGEPVPSRKPRTWRKRYRRLVDKLDRLSGSHYGALRKWLSQDRD